MTDARLGACALFFSIFVGCSAQTTDVPEGPQATRTAPEPEPNTTPTTLPQVPSSTDPARAFAPAEALSELDARTTLRVAPPGNTGTPSCGRTPEWTPELWADKATRTELSAASLGNCVYRLFVAQVSGTTSQLMLEKADVSANAVCAGPKGRIKLAEPCNGAIPGLSCEWEEPTAMIAHDAGSGSLTILRQRHWTGFGLPTVETRDAESGAVMRSANYILVPPKETGPSVRATKLSMVGSDLLVFGGSPQAFAGQVGTGSGFRLTYQGFFTFSCANTTHSPVEVLRADSF